MRHIELANEQPYLEQGLASSVNGSLHKILGRELDGNYILELTPVPVSKFVQKTPMHNIVKEHVSNKIHHNTPVPNTPTPQTSVQRINSPGFSMNDENQDVSISPNKYMMELVEKRRREIHKLREAGRERQNVIVANPVQPVSRDVVRPRNVKPKQHITKGTSIRTPSDLSSNGVTVRRTQHVPRNTQTIVSQPTIDHASIENVVKKILQNHDDNAQNLGEDVSKCLDVCNQTRDDTHNMIENMLKTLYTGTNVTVTKEYIDTYLDISKLISPDIYLTFEEDSECTYTLVNTGLENRTKRLNIFVTGIFDCGSCIKLESGVFSNLANREIEDEFIDKTTLDRIPGSISSEIVMYVTSSGAQYKVYDHYVEIEEDIFSTSEEEQEDVDEDDF